MEDKYLPEELNHSQPEDNRHFLNSISSWMKMLNGFMGLTASNPEITLRDDQDELVISIDIQGFDPQDLDISVCGNLVKIIGDNRRQEIQNKPGRHYAIQSWNRFYREIPLPAFVKSEKTVAIHNNSYLQITMPKGKTAIRNFKPIIQSSDKPLLMERFHEEPFGD